MLKLAPWVTAMAMRVMAEPLLEVEATSMSSLSFEIQGMHCGSCVQKVENAVKKLKLDLSVKVQLVQPPIGWLEIESDQNLEEVSKLVIAAVEALDLQIIPEPLPRVQVERASAPVADTFQTFEFEVLGMKCGSCVNKAEKAINSISWPSIREAPTRDLFDLCHPPVMFVRFAWGSKLCVFGSLFVSCALCFCCIGEPIAIAPGQREFAV